MPKRSDEHDERALLRSCPLAMGMIVAQLLPNPKPTTFQFFGLQYQSLSGTLACTPDERLLQSQPRGQRHGKDTSVSYRVTQTVAFAILQKHEHPQPLHEDGFPLTSWIAVHLK